MGQGRIRASAGDLDRSGSLNLSEAHGTENPHEELKIDLMISVFLQGLHKCCRLPASHSQTLQIQLWIMASTSMMLMLAEARSIRGGPSTSWHSSPGVSVHRLLERLAAGAAAAAELISQVN